MNPAQALSLKVDGYLKQIRNLNSVQNASGGGDANTIVGLTDDNRIRSDKFRRFTLLQSIFIHEEQRIDKSSVETTQELTKMKNAILHARRELRATQDDIKSARIFMPSRKPLDQFHFYLQLPGPVVREHILSYLTDPQDQLNMIEAVPSEEQLMHWNRENIKLELVFRIMMERVFDLDYINDPLGMTYAFSRASQVHQFIVERYILSKGILLPDLNGYSSFDLMRELEVRRDVDSDSFLPAEVSFYICLDGSDDSILRFNQKISHLQIIGHRIWICSIWLTDVSSSPLQILQVLSNFLSLMPNVKVLTLCISHGDDNPGALTTEEIEREKKSIENFQLPECTSLRVLGVWGSSSMTITLTIATILAKYAVGLSHLWIQKTTEDDTNIVEIPSAPKLFFLDVGSQRGMSGIPQYLRMFPNASLKYLRLSVPEENSGVNFPHVLSFISRQYGHTLEELELENLSCPDLAAPCLLESAWMLEASFPKVKRLRLWYDYDQKVYGLTFVMLFPALEELYLRTEHATDGFFGTDPNYLELSLNRQDMLKSVTWKVFPKLSFVEFANGGFRAISRFTRKDCIEAQQNTE